MKLGKFRLNKYSLNKTATAANKDSNSVPQLANVKAQNGMLFLDNLN